MFLRNCHYLAVFHFPEFTSFSLFSSSARGKVKPCVFVPYCALWCPLRTWWELSAYHSKSLSSTKVLVTIWLQYTFKPPQKTQPLHLHATTCLQNSTHSMQGGRLLIPFHCSCLFNQHNALLHTPIAPSKPDHFYSELSCSID